MEGTGHDRLTEEKEIMAGGEGETALSTLLEAASILHHILHHQEEAQMPVIIISHMVAIEDLGIGKEHVDIVRRDQVIDMEDLQTVGVSPEIERGNIDHGVIHLAMKITEQEVVDGVKRHKDLQETIMVPEAGMMVEDQQHQNKTIVGGVAVPAM